MTYQRFLLFFGLFVLFFIGGYLKELFKKCFFQGPDRLDSFTDDHVLFKEIGRALPTTAVLGEEAVTRCEQRELLLASFLPIFMGLARAKERLRDSTESTAAAHWRCVSLLAAVAPGSFQGEVIA